MIQQARIIKFKPHHLLLLDLQEEQKHFFNNIKTSEQLIQYGKILLDGAADTDDNKTCAWTAIVGDEIIGCGGILRVQEHVGEAWILIGKKFKKYAHRLVSEIKRQIAITGLVRVYSLIDLGFDRAERFIQWMGFEYEGTMKKSGTSGQDQKIYARIRER